MDILNWLVGHIVTGWGVDKHCWVGGVGRGG